MNPIIIDELGSYSCVERTSSGGWAVPATLTRTGIFKYVDESGKTINVLRPKEEVLRDESLATLAHCPVTVYHPAEREVTPSNYRRVVVGIVGGSPQVLGDKYVAARLRIEDEETGKKIDTRDLCEVSCGYRADYALNPDGSYKTTTFEGQHVDRIQTNIRYNHVSLGPKGWGRAGSDVGIKLDGVDCYVVGMDNVRASYNFNDDAAAPVAPVAPAPAVVTDSVPRAEFDKLQARLDMVLLQLAAPKAPSAPVVDEKAVAARAALVADAKSIAPGLVIDANDSDADVRTKALKATSLKFEGKSSAYIDAAFDMAVEQRKTVVDSHQQVASHVSAPVVDAGADPLAKAYADNVAAYVTKS